MLVKYGGINLGPCGPLLLLKAVDIMVGGRYLINGGRKKNHVGINIVYRGINGGIPQKSKMAVLLQ